MLFAVAQLAPDADDEHCAIFLGNGVFALFGAEVGVKLAQFFGVYEVQLVRQAGLDGGEHLINHVFGAYHGGIDAVYDFFQEFDAAVLRGDDPFPVPLVHVEGMQVAQFFVGPDGIHVRIDAISGFYVVFCQGEPFPFGQRVYDLCLYVAHVFDGERNGALHAVQVIVDAHAFQHEQRGGDASQA